jgi:3-oxoacyl-[acyl-carrier protein] reductase
VQDPHRRVPNGSSGPAVWGAGAAGSQERSAIKQRRVINGHDARAGDAAPDIRIARRVAAAGPAVERQEERMRQVIVTGGGTGIGRAVAEVFAEAGDQVVITGRRAAVLKETAAELGPGVRGVAFDAADPGQIEAALSDLPSQVDVLVNSAGGNTDIGAAPPVGLAGLAAAWRANLDANVLTAVLVTEALRPGLAPGGTVISISSIAAHRPGAGSYSAAKAAVEAWNLSLAQDLGADRITANVIAPGFIDGTGFFGSGMTDQRRATLIGQTFTGRAGQPADIAGLALFLASPAASHITGQVLHVNGGALPSR